MSEEINNYCSNCSKVTGTVDNLYPGLVIYECAICHTRKHQVKDCPANHEQLYWGWKHHQHQVRGKKIGIGEYELSNYCPPCPKCQHEIEEPK